MSNVPGHSLENRIYKHFRSLNFSASSYGFLCDIVTVIESDRSTNDKTLAG